MSDYYIREKCRLCNDHNIIAALTFPETPIANNLTNSYKDSLNANKYPLTICRCKNCGHVQLTTVIDPSKLFEQYVYLSGTSPVFVSYLDSYAKEIVERFNLTSEDKVLEIASNDGTFLNSFRQLGISAIGIDPAKNVTEIANSKGLMTITDFFNKKSASKIKNTLGLFKVIIANNVMAHVDNFQEIVEAAENLLTPDGIFIFEVGYFVDVVEKLLFDTIYHEHLSYHTVKPLLKFFKTRGLELFDVQRTESQGGSIRVYVSQLQQHPVNFEIGKLCKKEEDLGLYKYEGYKEFIARLTTARVATDECLRSIKATAGWNIVGFGAPAKAVTLCRVFGINTDLLDFIVDENPLKHNKYLPGAHIPIYHPDNLEELNPNYVFILAWNFADDIIKRYKKPGRAFIIPLPELKIINE